MSRALSVVAIVAAYNEADVIEPVVRDLIANGVSVYLIDDGSTDDTARLVEPLVGHGVVAVERFGRPPDDAGARTFAWERLLQRKAQLAADLDADWFIHHDADEFRESPWAGVSLLDGIRRVDALGYNAIDFANLDFWPTHDGFRPGADPRHVFPWYSDAATYDRVQVRCWRKEAKVDLASSGGHDVQFDSRRVFPIRFISRHYPIRGQAHGERKIFVERRPRFTPKERERNWHVQYDDVQEGASFVRDTCELTHYDGDAVRIALTLRHRGVEALETALDNARCETLAARDESARQTVLISELNGNLASHHDEGLQLRAALDSRAMELGETRAQLAHVHEALHARNVELGDVHTELGRVHAELDDVQRTVAEHTRENDRLRSDVDRREDQVSQMRAALEQQTQAAAKARTQAEMRERQLAAQGLELANLRTGLTDVRGRLDAFQQSWSWRVTAPARELLRRLRGY
jgi:glycosyltransferase involved in cell wall biosynthesis